LSAGISGSFDHGKEGLQKLDGLAATFTIE